MVTWLILASTLLQLCVTDGYNYYWYDKAQTLANRQTMVHLFEWKWTDVAAECENFLQYYGYGAVQVISQTYRQFCAPVFRPCLSYTWVAVGYVDVHPGPFSTPTDYAFNEEGVVTPCQGEDCFSLAFISPPNDHIILYQNDDVPWWVRYQPVSYNLVSRSGDEDQFKDMVDRCNKVGVRIVVDVVMNHMVGVGQKFGVDGRSSSYGKATFDGTDGIESFPGVPYSKADFNDDKCHGDIQNSDYQNSAEHVKNCRLTGLLDLNQGSVSVQNKIVAYLNKLIDYGVAGFRCDASKHMWPADLGAILNATKNLREDIFGVNQRPFVVHEVIDRGGEAVKCTDYLGVGRYTNFNFGSAVSSAAKGQSDWKLLARLGPGYQYGNNEDHDVLNFIDNHDNQRDTSPYVVTYKDGDEYRLAVAYMLAWPYGYPRVMSSFYFTQHDHGPPIQGSGGYATSSPTFNGDDLTCKQESGWVCEHRWPTIREMVKFRAATQGAAATQITTDNQRVAFAREGKGFFAVNGGTSTWSKFFPTTLPAGNYCDHYGGALENDKCTGETITVKDDGTAYLEVPSKKAIAFSIASRIGGPPTPAVKPTTGYSRTILFIKKDTYQGQNLFIRGGVSHANNNACSVGPYQQGTDKCAIPIVHNTTVPFVYAEYLTWSQGDDYLDFEGAELNQGTHDGEAPFGTPLAYSTNDATAVEYQPYNKYGSGYWMVQLLVDCTKTDQGWFEIKGYISPSIGWEPDVSQSTCTGALGGAAPFSSINHIAKCGAVNVFTWGTGDCVIDSV